MTLFHPGRRQFCKTAGAAALGVSTMGFPAIASSGNLPRRIVVLGADGMDPTLLETLMQKGLMPNCSRLAARGTFSRINTSYPPQSPVAWSDFISGANPGIHGIFDFIARDPETMMPYLSTSKTSPAKEIKLGKFSIPLGAPKVELMRQGPTLWNILADNGIRSTAFKAPVNYPPAPGKASTLAGITTPDIQGSYGVFSFYSENPSVSDRAVAGGQISRIRVRSHRAVCRLEGPPPEDLEADIPSIDIEVELNKKRTEALLHIQGERLLLKEGDWSRWVRVSFPMPGLLNDVSGICRLYLKQVSPHLELYVSPVNLDPEDPALPIASPENFARQVARRCGPFYTQGFPEDTAALSAGVFSDAEYRQQATFVLEERLKLFHDQFSRFRDGFFFFYFSSLDLDSHTFWRCIDEGHPLHTPELVKEHGDFLPWIYRRLDKVVGDVIDTLDENDLVFVVSDHGFTSFRRQFNLNSWLLDEGYAALFDPYNRDYTTLFQDTDWSRTRAYGLGINSLYLNLKGREAEGIVTPAEADRLRKEIAAKLSALTDPDTGEKVFAGVYLPEDIYSGPQAQFAPDLVLGYNRHHRASWDTVLGAYPRQHLLDNLDPWSGDHCMDPSFLQGVLLTNLSLPGTQPSLRDLAPTILGATGIPAPGVMHGKDIRKGAAS